MTASPLLAIGGPDATVDPGTLGRTVDQLATDIVASGARRVLLVPPDITRRQSGAGPITGRLFERLTGSGCQVGVLPALGTHAPMTPAQVRVLFGDRVPVESVRAHRWRERLVRLGEITDAEVAEVSAGRLSDPIPVDVNEELIAGWDLVVSVGQVVPHEVIGMANFTKNLIIGLGGAPTIGRTHYLGALCGLETLMGRPDTSVRRLVDAAFDRFLAPRTEVLWILTVMQDTEQGVVHRGLFVGRGRTTDSGGAAFRAAAELSVRLNVQVVPEPLDRVACWLQPDEFTTTWVGNKAVYRTRMALADGGELIVLAPGVSRFGEDPTADALIRRHGYRGTAATLDAVRRDPELAGDLGVAAHLIHGSSEKRFRIVYCTDPSAGGLTPDEVTGAGYLWRPLPEEVERLALPAGAPSGWRLDRNGDPFSFIANPALGLWAASTAF